MASQKRWTQIQGLHILKDKPDLRMLVLDISNKCNFNCMYCYAKENIFQEQNKPLNLQDYFDLFDEAKRIGVKGFWFLGGHENTLNSIYLDLNKKLDELNLFSVTLTNGAAFGDDNIAQKLYSLSAKEFTGTMSNFRKASIILKTDSLNELVQNNLSKNNNSFNQIRAARKNLLESKFYAEKPFGLPRIGINSVLTKQNSQEIGKIFNYALKKEIVYFCDSLLDSGSAKKNKNLKLNDEDLEICFSGIKKTLDKHKINAIPRDVINFYDHNCVLFDNYLFVLNNGDVVPCAGFNKKDAIIGNIKDGLQKIKDTKLKLIKEYYSDNPSCIKCPCKEYLEK